MELAAIIIITVVFVAATIGMVAGSFAQIGPGTWGLVKSGVLWAIYGLLAGLFNGPQIKSNEHPTLLETLGVPLALGGATAGAAFAALYDALTQGAWSGLTAAPGLRVATALAGGTVLGAIAGLLFVQVIAAAAAILGAAVNYQADQNIVQWLADSAQGMLQEGGFLAVWAGAVVGAIAGITIGIVNRV